MRLFVASTLINWGLKLLPAGTPGRAQVAAGMINLTEHQIGQLKKKGWIR